MIELTNSSTFENFPHSYEHFSQHVEQERTTDPYLPSIRSFLNSTSISGAFFPKTQEIYSSAVSPEVSDVRQIWQERGASTLHLATIQTQRLASLYTLREPMEVVQFFRTHLSLISLLIEMYSKLKLYFSDAQISLQFVADSDNIETQGNNGDLVVSIVTQLTPLEAVTNLDAFYEQQWLYAANEFQDKEKICFNLECI